MKNKNAVISPKVSDFPEEILTIFNECYNDFKNTYGEKHLEHIKSLIENITDKEQFENLVRNVVAYAISNNSCRTNWIAQELLVDVIPDELIAEIFNE